MRPERHRTRSFLRPGEFRLVLDHGRFASTQYNEQVCTWNHGTYALTGQNLELTITGGGGQSPNRRYNKPGEIFEFGVSLYHDSMKWSQVPMPNPGG